MADERAYGFSRADAGELINMIGSGAGEFSEEWPISGKGGGGGNGWILNTTSVITAAAGSTLGSGTADVLKRNGNILEVTGESITVYNTQEVSIASGSIIQAKNVGGDAYADVERCEV